MFLLLWQMLDNFHNRKLKQWKKRGSCCPAPLLCPRADWRTAVTHIDWLGSDRHHQFAGSEWGPSPFYDFLPPCFSLSAKDQGNVHAELQLTVSQLMTKGSSCVTCSSSSLAPGHLILIRIRTFVIRPVHPCRINSPLPFSCTWTF